MTKESRGRGWWRGKSVHNLSFTGLREQQGALVNVTTFLCTAAFLLRRYELVCSGECTLRPVPLLRVESSLKSENGPPYFCYIDRTGCSLGRSTGESAGRAISTSKVFRAAQGWPSRNTLSTSVRVVCRFDCTAGDSPFSYPVPLRLWWVLRRKVLISEAVATDVHDGGKLAVSASLSTLSCSPTERLPSLPTRLFSTMTSTGRPAFVCLHTAGI